MRVEEGVAAVAGAGALFAEEAIEVDKGVAELLAGARSAVVGTEVAREEQVEAARSSDSAAEVEQEK